MGLKEKLELKKAAAVQEYDEMLFELAKDLKTERDAGFEEGAAQAGIPVDDKIYTESDLQAEIKIAKELATQEAELGAQAKIDSAVEAKSAEIVADYESSQVDDAAFLAKYKKVAPAVVEE